MKKFGRNLFIATAYLALALAPALTKAASLACEIDDRPCDGGAMQVQINETTDHKFNVFLKIGLGGLRAPGGKPKASNPKDQAELDRELTAIYSGTNVLTDIPCNQNSENPLLFSCFTITKDGYLSAETKMETSLDADGKVIQQLVFEIASPNTKVAVENGQLGGTLTGDWGPTVEASFGISGSAARSCESQSPQCTFVP